MADYNEILDTEIDQDSYFTDVLFAKMRDNPIASLEGAPGAPRVKLKALENLVAGDSVRASDSASVTNTGTSTYVTILGFGFGQSGTVRCRITLTGGSSNPTYRVLRTRYGSAVTLSASAGNIVTDISVIPGDVLSLQMTGAGNSISSSAAASIGVDTGISVWPIITSRVTGNDV